MSGDSPSSSAAPVASGARVTLKRSLSLPLLTLYGVGTIVGGGFYALLGKVAGEAGMLAPVAFLTAASIALFTALSYGALASRFPVSAGEAEYVRVAFGRPWLSATIGWLVIITGLVSAAALSRAIVGFLGDFAAIPLAPSLIVVVGLLGAVAAWGIVESVWLSVIITVIEVGGLLLVVALRSDVVAELPSRWGALVPDFEMSEWRGIGLGAFLAFYALIGFEDMVNVAEEVRAPRRTMPRALLLALGITTLLYLLVASVAVLAVPVEELAQSGTPVARVVAGYGALVVGSLGAISVLAGVNGALVQVIMSARVVYGMAERGGAPAWLGEIHSRTRTPVRATILMTVIVLALAMWFPLTTLARATSAVILVVFAMVNVSLLVVRARESRAGEGVRLGLVDLVPLVGAITCIAFLAFQGAALL